MYGTDGKVRAIAVLKCCADKISLHHDLRRGVATETILLRYTRFVRGLLYRISTKCSTIVRERFEIRASAMKIWRFSFE